MNGTESGAGNRLLELRRRHGLGQEELAGLTGLSRNTIYLVEKGKRKPSPATLKTLSHFFGVSRSYILGYDVEEGEEPGKGGAPQLLGRLRELDAEDRRLLLRGLWPTWTTDAEADARGVEIAGRFLREAGASPDELRRLLVSLDPLQARRLIAEGAKQMEAEQAYRRLLFEGAAAGDLTAAEAARRAEEFGGAA